jgi:hypothetical protein
MEETSMHGLTQPHPLPVSGLIARVARYRLKVEVAALRQAQCRN